MTKFLREKDFPLSISKSRLIKIWPQCKAADRVADRLGYHSIEPPQDELLDIIGTMVGLQNEALHSGWIATEDSSEVRAADQIALLNKKVKKVAEKEKFIIGLYRTGKYSIGYSIYVLIKEERK